MWLSFLCCELAMRLALQASAKHAAITLCNGLNLLLKDVVGV